MPVEMNKYKHPVDGSVCVMPHTRDSVETKHGVFKRIYSEGADNSSPRAIVMPSFAMQPVSEKKAAAGIVQVSDPSQVGKIIAPPSLGVNASAQVQTPVSPTPSSTVKLG